MTLTLKSASETSFLLNYNAHKDIPTDQLAKMVFKPELRDLAFLEKHHDLGKHTSFFYTSLARADEVKALQPLPIWPTIDELAVYLDQIGCKLKPFGNDGARSYSVIDREKIAHASNKITAHNSFNLTWNHQFLGYEWVEFSPELRLGLDVYFGNFENYVADLIAIMGGKTKTETLPPL